MKDNLFPAPFTTDETFRNLGKSSNQTNSQKNKAEDLLNSTNQNSLRCSNLVTEFQNQSKNIGIHCPTHNDSGIYKCQICKGLRQVCPKNHNTHTKNIYNSVSYNNVTNTDNFQTQPTAYFNDGKQQYNKINYSKTFQMHPKPQIYSSQVPTFAPKRPTTQPSIIIHPNPTYNTIKNLRRVYPSTSQRITFKQLNPPNIANTIHYRHQPLPSPHTRFIQQIVYVPVIHNCIKPEIIATDPRSFSNSRYKSTAEYGTTRDASLVGSPVRGRRSSEKQILTPLGMRKLAQSLIR